MKVEKVRPQRITKADEQSITQNLLEIEPPGNDGTEVEWLNYGDDLWRIKRSQEATAAFDQAIKRKPDFYQAYFAKGIAIQAQEAEKFLQEGFFEENPFEEAALSFTSSTEKTPQSSSSEKELPPEASFESKMQEIESEMQEIKGDVDILAQKSEQVMKTVEKGMKKSAGKFTSLNQGSAKALPFFKKATEINPDFYPAWREIGMIKSMEMNSQRMSEMSAASSNPNPPLSPKATMAAQEALAAFNKATALNPSDTNLYESKGRVLQDLSRHQEAIKAYSAAIKIDPTASSYYFRRVSYCAVGDEQKAAADLKSAGKLGYQNAANLPACGQGHDYLDYYSN